MLDPIAVGAALAVASAALNATWNLRIKASGDPLRVAALAFPLATALATPLVVAAWLLTGQPGVPWPALVIVLISGAVQVVYLHILSRAYRDGDISSVYPTARGTAPIVAVALGVLVLGERLTGIQWVAVAILVGGVWLVRPGAASAVALLPAITVGVLIAGYSALDRLGVQAAPWWLYGWLVQVVISILLLPSAHRGIPGVPLVAVLVGASIVCVLVALSIAPLAVVAPVRFVGGTVIVAAWGVLRFGERERMPQKLAGAAALVAGVVLLSV